MKNLLVLASGVLLSVASSLSLAGPAEPNTFYAGGSLGKVTLDIEASWSLLVDTDPGGPAPPPTNPPQPGSQKIAHYKASDSEAFMLGAIGGYNIYDWLAVEAQYTGNLMSNDILGNEMSVDTSAFGVYGVYQKGGDAFFRLRLGFGRSTAKFQSDADGSVSESSVYASWGASVGQKLGPGHIEFMYMRYPDVKMDRVKFASTFNRGSSALISRDLTFETLTVAYIYTF